jgi:hypothetical protein
MITITDHGRGEITFGALQAGLDIEYSRSSVGFTWEGFDEMDKVSGDGSLNCAMTAPSRSNSPITTATKPSSKPNERLLQQPASLIRVCSAPSAFVLNVLFPSTTPSAVLLFKTQLIKRVKPTSRSIRSM